MGQILGRSGSGSDDAESRPKSAFPGFRSSFIRREKGEESMLRKSASMRVPKSRNAEDLEEESKTKQTEVTNVVKGEISTGEGNYGDQNITQINEEIKKDIPAEVNETKFIPTLDEGKLNESAKILTEEYICPQIETISTSEIDSENQITVLIDVESKKELLAEVKEIKDKTTHSEEQSSKPGINETGEIKYEKDVEATSEEESGDLETRQITEEIKKEILAEVKGIKDKITLGEEKLSEPEIKEIEKTKVNTILELKQNNNIKLDEGKLSETDQQMTKTIDLVKEITSEDEVNYVTKTIIEIPKIVKSEHIEQGEENKIVRKADEDNKTAN